MYAPQLLAGLMLYAALLTGCGVNPVTGDSEMAFVSEAEEINIGKSQYQPSQQSQGGQYYLDPALNEYVSRVGQSLAKVSDRPNLPYEFVILNNSVPNAWALPGGKIAVNRGLLLHLEDEAELAAVIGHEIVHAAARHGAQAQERGTLLGIGIAALGVAAGSEYGSLARQGGQIGSALIQTRYGRSAELESDYYGMLYMSRAGYDPQGAVRLQETFVRLSESRQSDWISGLFASHPPSLERVEANRNTAAKLAGGRDGRMDYQRATAQLRKDAPAYSAYDKALKAFSEEKPDEALKLVQEAKKIQPREGLFHELEGVILASRDDKKAAITHLARAVELNPNFYRHQVLLGKLHFDAGDLDAAERDFSAANRLLETADAYYGLGEIAARKGDVNTALKYLDPVARSQSPLAPAARDRIIQLRSGTGSP